MSTSGDWDDDVPSPVSSDQDAEHDSGPVADQDTFVLLTEPADGIPGVIDTQAELDAAASVLRTELGPVALDAERASGIRYGQRAFLIQLRREDGPILLVDPEAIADFSALAEAIAGSEWILHAATQDLACLAELGLRPSRLFDTELAGRLLGLPRVGLASLTEELLGITLAKSHSAADWSRRPLPTSWLSYAALDVELLHELREELIGRLQDTGRWDWAQQEFTALLDFQPKVHPEPWRRVSGISAAKTPQQLAVVRALWSAREDVASKLDRAPGRVLPDAAIVAAAEAGPKNLRALSELPAYARQGRRLRRWWEAIASAQSESGEELPGKPLRVGIPHHRTWRRSNPEAAARYEVARGVILRLADTLAIAPEVLIPPDAVRAITWTDHTGADAAALAEDLSAAGARPWQIAEVAQELAVALRPTETTNA
ncbi:MAG: HRDC domain-containing protein [Actinomycetia bacterium]|nr:HRDC domain-containing protein [Actinomycetes bacterium]